MSCYCYLLPSTLVFCARHISTMLPFVVSRFCILFCFLPVGLFVILKTCLPAIGPTPHSFLPCRERYEQQACVQQGGFFTFGSETSALRSIPGTSVKWLIMVIFWRGLAEPFKSRTLESLEDSGLQESLEDYIKLRSVSPQSPLQSPLRSVSPQSLIFNTGNITKINFE